MHFILKFPNWQLVFEHDGTIRSKYGRLARRGVPNLLAGRRSTVSGMNVRVRLSASIPRGSRPLVSVSFPPQEINRRSGAGMPTFTLRRASSLQKGASGWFSGSVRGLCGEPGLWPNPYSKACTFLLSYSGSPWGPRPRHQSCCSLLDNSTDQDVPAMAGGFTPFPHMAALTRCPPVHQGRRYHQFMVLES